MPSVNNRDPQFDSVYDDDVEQLVTQLQKAASERNSVVRSEIANAVHSISQHASVRGLAKGALEALVDKLTTAPCYLDQSTVAGIVKILLPRGKVSDNAVVKIIGCFGQGQTKPPIATQSLLLRWLVMVYSFLDDYVVLSKLYGVLFNLLDMISLRGHLCHLLSLMTRRKHVKPFRIQTLLELKRKVGNEQPLLGLLQTYKDYYPDVIVGEVGRIKAGLFSHPNPEWLQKVLAIQEASAANSQDAFEKSSFRVIRKVGGRGSKRVKTGHVALPAVHTYRAVESSVTLEEVENVEDFVAKIDRLELPNQLVAVIEDPLLQKLLALRPSDVGNARINNWLAGSLSDMLGVSKATSPGVTGRMGDLLSKVLKYTWSTRQLLPAIEDFLEIYLKTWDGKMHRETILGLMCYLPLTDYEELAINYITPVEILLKDDDEMATVHLLEFYTELLRQWSITYQTRTPDEEALDDESLTLQKFLTHVNDICIAGIDKFPKSSLVSSAVLSFYECSSDLPWRNGLFRAVLPPDALLYRFVFMADAMMLSRICGILSNYKRAFELSLKASQTNEPSGIEEYPRHYVNHFNGLLMDVCNCCWRNRAFKRGGPDSKQDQNALGCCLPEEAVVQLKKIADAREESLTALFSLSHSAVLAQYATECFRAHEDSEPGIKARHAGPVTQRSLNLLATNGGLKMSYANFRVLVINDLGRRGLYGIWDFMRSTMISLIQSSGIATAGPSKAVA
ncbi:hypothetical protein RUND412_000340 [Rhizina undulata]